MLEKRYIGDGVYIEIRHGLFLLTCEAPAIPNGIFIDREIADHIKAYVDEAYARMGMPPQADTEPDPDSTESGG